MRIKSYHQKISPLNANTEKKILSLKTDNFSTDYFGVLLEFDRVHLSEYTKKPNSSKLIKTIPRDDFDKIVKWYVRKQVKRKNKRGRNPLPNTNRPERLTN